MSHKAKSPKSGGGGLPPLELVGAKSKDATKLEDIDIQQLTAVSAPINRRINALKNEQLKLLDLESKFYEELHELECKYGKLYEPIYQKRRQIVVGEYEPSEEESKWALDNADAESEKKGDDENKANGGTETADESKLTESGKKLLEDLKTQFGIKKGDGANEEKGIPNFWLETLQSLSLTAEMIQEHDEPLLAYLQDVRVRLFDKKPYGYTLEFEFAENPYFSNKVLTKTYVLKTELDPKDPFSFEGPDLEKATGCKIEWKAGKNVTVKLIKKKLKPRNKKQAPKIITKEEKQDSFFTFFDTPKTSEKSKQAGAKSGDGAETKETSEGGDKQVAVKADTHPDEDDEDDDEDENESELYLMADFETGQYIKDKVIPKALLYYTGELDDMDDNEYDEDYDDDLDDEDDDDDGENDDDDDEDNDDDDDDDDDEEEDAGGKGGKKGGKGGKKHGGANPGGKHGGKAAGAGGKPGEPTPSECKQN